MQCARQQQHVTCMQQQPRTWQHPTLSKDICQLRYSQQCLQCIEQAQASLRIVTHAVLRIVQLPTLPMAMTKTTMAGLLATTTSGHKESNHTYPIIVTALKRRATWLETDRLGPLARLQLIKTHALHARKIAPPSYCLRNIIADIMARIKSAIFLWQRHAPNVSASALLHHAITHNPCCNAKPSIHKKSSSLQCHCQFVVQQQLGKMAVCTVTQRLMSHHHLGLA